ncbi:trypsin-like peptidase domain-containing protein [Candidatus Woesearchaeota archaeon]|nr:trypsin-like peptidase domain-containing protein [Candidatus Woesearchaeota archaeon]
MRVASALESFLQNFYNGECLSEVDAKKNLELGVVEIVGKKGHLANGLLVTSNGYFLTAKHCVDHEPKKMKKRKIRLHDQQEYAFEKVCVWSEERDVALAKATMPGECKPMLYKFCNTSVKLKEQPLLVLTRWDGKLTLRSSMLEKHLKRKLYFKGEIYASYGDSVPGDSGGSLVSLDGRVMGIHTHTLKGNSPIFDLYGSTKIVEALEVMSVYCGHLKKRMKK